jgi:hypothetical protein
MATWYPMSGLSWEQYLQVSSYSGDIKAEIARQSQRVSGAIASGSHEIVGTTEQIQAAFSEGSEQMAEALFDLGVQFDYSMGLVIDALQVQSQQLQAIVQHLDAIKKALESPLLTQSRELFRIGCDRLAKGLLDKALQAFLEAERKNETDFFTEYYIGKLYLYGHDEDDNVIDLPLARQHLLAAVRYGKAEIPRDQSFQAPTGEALFHASIACYALAGAEPPAATQRIREAYELVAEAVRLHPDLSEGWFHAAKYKAIQGDDSESMAALGRAISGDPRYAAKAVSDGAFSPIAPALTAFINRLRCEKRTESEAALRNATAAVARSQAYESWMSAEGRQLHEEAASLLTCAQIAYDSGTYLGYADASASAARAVTVANESRQMREEAARAYDLECAKAEQDWQSERRAQLKAEAERRQECWDWVYHEWGGFGIVGAVVGFFVGLGRYGEAHRVNLYGDSHFDDPFVGAIVGFLVGVMVAIGYGYYRWRTPRKKRPGQWT